MKFRDDCFAEPVFGNESDFLRCCDSTTLWLEPSCNCAKQIGSRAVQCSDSDDLTTWDGGQAILQPKYPWEFVQIGNCGSPIELDEGWLLLTHGVGPVRKYSIGAALLDKKDPSRVLARSVEPLLHPEQSEREGYVPNVVYTCGAMRHNDQIILPYAISDTYSNFATIKIGALLQAMS